MPTLLYLHCCAYIAVPMLLTTLDDMSLTLLSHTPDYIANHIAD